MQSPEVQQKISTLRQKALAGTLTPDECKEGIILLRGSRRSAATEATARKRGPAKSTDELLKELDKL